MFDVRCVTSSAFVVRLKWEILSDVMSNVGRCGRYKRYRMQPAMVAINNKRIIINIDQKQNKQK
ncbi:hypothetical protein HanRHA438_Chr03g0133211 [Helianthus annuus]|nr:hypothetical protein HanIR_Chr03g0132491 [Helianthus annuus]KAJ0936618.1 hypothetical protein HanRHA438_Chr03g0133211 [Helianthus annuus]